MQLRSPIRATLLAVALCLAAPATAYGATYRTGSLLPLIESAADRVQVADQVAAAKFGTTQPINDPVREQEVLDTMAAKAPALGLDPAAVIAFFRNQIEANKLVQRGLYALWTAHPGQVPTHRPDLAALRPVIDRINDALLTELAATAPTRTGITCDIRIVAGARLVDARRRLDKLHADALTRSLHSACQG
ncbi:MAG TPA: chorismate mutase [Amycolatopsis sp.]|jgi:chorismate mutase|nr:chorismate mutase [Amycolatopsis sp.]